MNKNIIILNLLIGWEIIHLSKKSKKLSIRLREFPGGDNRFIRITFSQCSLVAYFDVDTKQTENFKQFNFKNSFVKSITAEDDGIISFRIIKDKNNIGIFKIVSDEIEFEFTSK